MHYQDDMTGFLSELKGGGSATPAPSNTNPGPLMSAAAAAAASSAPSSSLRPRSALNGLSLPAFSTALSSSTGNAGPVSRTFSGFRSATGEASIGSFNTGLAALHHPPSLSADPPLQHPPPRAPTSPIPHLHQSAFAPSSSYHTFGPPPLSHLNASPSSVATQSLNYSPPPHSSQVPVSAAPPPQQPPHIQRLPAPQPSNHRPSAAQPASAPARSRLHRPQDPPPVTYAAYVTPQPQTVTPIYPPAAVVKLEQQHHHHHQIPVQLHPAPQPTSTAASAVTAVPLSSSDGGSQPEARRQGSSRAPAKRARTASDCPSQLSPTTPRSTAGAGTQGSGHYWAHQAATNRSGQAAAEGVSAPAEEQSRPERKREREKRRRETMNTRFSELAACLVISAGGKTDKESILAEAVDHVKKQAAVIEDLEKQNKDLLAEAKSLREEKNELRQDKNYIRKERDTYKADVEALKSDNKRRKRSRSENGVKDDDSLVKIKDERINGIKAEVKA